MDPRRSDISDSDASYLYDFLRTSSDNKPNSAPTESSGNSPHSSSPVRTSSKSDHLPPSSSDDSYSARREFSDDCSDSQDNYTHEEEEESYSRPPGINGFSPYSRPRWWYRTGNSMPYGTNCSPHWPSNGYRNHQFVPRRQIETNSSVPPCSTPTIKTGSTLVGAGLENLGLSCFLNVVLQCFTHTVPLVQGLRSFHHSSACEDRVKDFCLICELRSHIDNSLAERGDVIDPKRIFLNLSKISPSLRPREQEDAHEFLQCLLNKLDSCCNTFAGQCDNFVKQVFGGRLINKLRCCNCGHSSDSYEPLIDLSLEIDDVVTLQSALRSFTKAETIEDCFCENCRERVSKEKQIMLDRAPSVAACHLKRFKMGCSGVEKITEHVEFPLVLNLRPYTNKSQIVDEDLKYDLYAVVVHCVLSPYVGHYYCIIRSAPYVWHLIDDAKVYRVSQDFVLSQQAYILFYAKQGTPWFSSFVETYVPCSTQSTSNTSPSSGLDTADNNHISSFGPADRQARELNETIDDNRGDSTESYNGLVHETEAIPATIDDSHRFSTPLEAEASSSSCKAEESYPVSPGENNFNQTTSEVMNNANVTPPTPRRPPTSDLYTEEQPSGAYLKGALVIEVSRVLSNSEDHVSKKGNQINGLSLKSQSECLVKKKKKKRKRRKRNKKSFP